MTNSLVVGKHSLGILILSTDSVSVWVFNILLKNE